VTQIVTRPTAGARLLAELATEAQIALVPSGLLLAAHPTFLLPEPIRLADLAPAPVRREGQRSQ
jgi:hypothetical protein